MVLGRVVILEGETRKPIDLYNNVCGPSTQVVSVLEIASTSKLNTSTPCIASRTEGDEVKVFELRAFKSYIFSMSFVLRYVVENLI